MRGALILPVVLVIATCSDMTTVETSSPVATASFSPVSAALTAGPTIPPTATLATDAGPAAASSGRVAPATTAAVRTTAEASAPPPTSGTPTATALSTPAPKATAMLPAPVLPQAPNCPVLPGDNVLNTDISAMPVHARSATWLASMSAGSARLHVNFGPYPYGYQIQFVGNDRPTVPVAFTYVGESDPGPYPLGADTPIEPFPDHHAFLINRDTCMLYELYGVNWNAGRPTAGSGAIFDLRSNALRPAGWTSADAAGLPIVPLLVRYEEVQAGAIKHAIRFAVQRTDRS